MMTVRFPSGFSVQYNDARCLQYIGNGPGEIARLYTAKENGKWIADVPLSSGALIETVPPCRTYNSNAIDSDKLFDEFMSKLRQFRVYRIADLKAALGAFDAKRKVWK